MEKSTNRIGKFIAVVSMAVLTIGVNQVCYWLFDQEEIPESARRLRRF